MTVLSWPFCWWWLLVGLLFSGLKINLNSFRQSKEGRDDDVVNVEA